VKVTREAQHRVPEGEALSLADLGLLVAHLQTVGQAPPDARVFLRVDLLRVEWETDQPSGAELQAEAERIRAEREEARSRAVAAEPEAAAYPAEEEVAYAEPEPVGDGVNRARRGRASSGA